MQSVLGDLGAVPTVNIDYKTYAARARRSTPPKDGTRFTNDNTRRGMFVSIEKVNTF